MTDAEYAEIRKNFSDRKWRLNNLYYILDEKGNKIRFKMNEAQEDLLNNLWYLNLILKARQLGFTTFLCILFLDLCLFNSNVAAGIIAHNREDSEEFFNNKVKFAYDNLPPQLRAERPNTTDRSSKLAFSNGSSIRVGTSLRSGTYQYLHISEFGKICAQYPHKAREIVTGALNTVHVGQYVFIESTAEGQEGYFYDYVKEAEKREQSGQKPTRMQFKLHFYAWWKHPGYRTDPAMVLITKDQEEYFKSLEALGVYLSLEQKAWYAEKQRQQGEDMFREFPSTPDEAFKASTVGAYYKLQMVFLRKNKRITRVPHEPSLSVNTGWDLGRDDMNTIWFHQRYGMENRIIDYYEDCGEDLAHYVRILQEKQYLYGNHYLPHDVEVKSLNDNKSRRQILEDLGLKNVITVERTSDLLASIDEVRRFLLTCWIDEEHCAIGIKHLDNYRKEWNDKMGVFHNFPRHDAAAHGADGIRTLACGYQYTPASSGFKRPNGSWRSA